MLSSSSSRSLRLRATLVVFPLAVLLGGIHLVGCTSVADDHAIEGKKALEACDVRTANKEFGAAFEADRTEGEYALAFVLTELGVLVDDPALQRLWPRLGFTRAFDSALLWGKDGVLAKLSAKSTSCSALFGSFPHPSVASNGPDFLDTIDATLTLGAVRDELQSLVPRLQKLADAAHVAGTTIGAKSERFLKIEGGCGLGSTEVQAPEMLLLAAGVEAIVAGLRAARAYDGDIPLKVVFDTSGDPAKTAWVDAMNAHFLHKQRSEGLDEARAHTATSARYVSEAIAAARATGSPSQPAFDWKKLPAGVLDDLAAFAKAAEESLASDKAVTVPTLVPALQVNVWSFFARPVDLTGKTPVTWSIAVQSGTNPPYKYIKEDPTVLEAEVGPRFTPNVFAQGSNFKSTLETRWRPLESWDAWKPALDPNGRFSAGYGCQ